MKYAIDGKPAYLIAQKNGISQKAFHYRVHAGWTVERAVTTPVYKSKYKIKKNGRYVKTCRSMLQVAKYLGTSKGTICGLFFRHGDKIELFGYTIKRT